MGRVYLTFVIFLCTLAALRAHAEDKEIKKLIKTDQEISKKIDDVAADLDKILSGKKSEVGPNKTTLIVRNLFNWAEGGVFKYSPNLDLRLNLPNLEKKLQVTFSTFDQDQENRGINRTRLKDAPLRENYGAGFRFFQKLDDVNTEFQPRLEYRDGFQLSYILKFFSVATTGIFTFHPEAHFFARTDSGLGQFVGLNSDLLLFKVITLTFVNEEQYQDRINLFSTNHGLVISHDWNDRMDQTYALIFESSSRPNFHLDRYTVSMSFHHEILPSVFHYRLTPYLLFPRYLDFKGSPGLNVELDVIF